MNISMLLKVGKMFLLLLVNMIGFTSCFRRWYIRNSNKNTGRHYHHYLHTRHWNHGAWN